MLSKGMSTGMEAAGELWLMNACRYLLHQYPSTDVWLFKYYYDGFDFLADFINPNPTEPSKYEAINRARAEWAREEREALRIDF